MLWLQPARTETPGPTARISVPTSRGSIEQPLQPSFGEHGTLSSKIRIPKQHCECTRRGVGSEADSGIARANVVVLLPARLLARRPRARSSPRSGRVFRDPPRSPILFPLTKRLAHPPGPQREWVARSANNHRISPESEGNGRPEKSEACLLPQAFSGLRHG